MSKENKDRPFIPIDDDFKIIRGHGTSVTLIETVEFINKKGEQGTRDEVQGYFATVAQALHHYMRIKSREKDYDSLEEFYKELKRISDELVKLEDLYKALDKLERTGGIK